MENVRELLGSWGMLAVAGAVAGVLLIALVVVQVLGGGSDGDDVATVTAPTSTTETTLDPSDADDAADDDEIVTADAGTEAETTTTTSSTTTSVDVTLTTVEADEVVEENADPAPDEDEDDSPQPTSPPATDGSCDVALAELGGQVGTIDAGTSGACGPLAVTIRPVDANDDLANVNWSTDLRVCERHASAASVAVTVATAGSSVSLTDPFVRPPAEADVDPVQRISITFPEGFAPDNGVQPIVVCRTSGAELSIVHWPTR